MTVGPVAEVSPGLSALLVRAERELSSRRGGPALALTLPRTDGEWLASGRLWACLVDGDPVGVAFVRDGVIVGVYVDRSCRRRGHARALVEAILAGSEPPIDALALPGDRGTKSLYESIGWKARLLTMRGA